MICFFYYLYFQYLIDEKNNITSNFTIGYSSSKIKAINKIKEYKNLQGFKDFPINCFKILKQRVKFNTKINKSEIEIFQLSHEYEKEGIDYPTIFGVFATEEKAQAELEKQKVKIPYKYYPGNFIIEKWKVDNDFIWQEGFSKVEERKMSEICIINLKNHTLDFERMNILANALVKVALDNNVAVFFNSFDYGEEIIKNTNMHNFFLMSDSFLYKNCDFLESRWFIKDNKSVFQNKESIKHLFIAKYSFFNKIIATIFEYEVNEIEILISDAIYAMHNKEDFNLIKTDRNGFLDNFNITLSNGKLQVYLQEISVTTQSASKVYDGKALIESDCELSGKLIFGHTSVLKAVGSRTDVGRTINEFEIKIIDADNKNVTEFYKINANYGVLEVLPLEITVIAVSAGKTYDGTMLTCSDYQINFDTGDCAAINVKVTVTGSQTEIGRSDNIVSACIIYDAEGNNVSFNFKIVLVSGILMVTE